MYMDMILISFSLINISFILVDILAIIGVSGFLASCSSLTCNGINSPFPPNLRFAVFKYILLNYVVHTNMSR